VIEEKEADYRMKKWASIVAGLTGLAGIAGMAETSTGAFAASSQTITVAFPDWGGNTTPYDKWLNPAIAEFQKRHPGVTVKLDPIVINSEAAYYTKLDLMERSPRTSPDVVYEDSFMIGPDEAAGYLQPIDEVAKWPQWKDFYPAMQNIVKLNGQIYGVMNSTDVQAIYYDVKLFKKAGLPVPWQPRNWNDVIHAALAIKAHDKGVIPLWLYTGFPMGEASSFRGFEVFLWGTHDVLYDYRTKKWVTGGPGFNAVWNLLQKVHDLGLEEPEADWSNPNGSSTLDLQLMPAQQVGMAFEGSWIGGNYLPGGQHPDKAIFSQYRVAKLPTESGPGYTDQSGGWALSVAKYASNAQLAVQFIEQASNQANLATYDAVSGSMPPRMDLSGTRTMQNAIKQNAFFKATLPFVQFTHFRPSVGNDDYDQISNEIAKLTGEIAMGQITASQAAQQYAQAVTQIAGASNVEKMTT
jgi:multiple sugar transport system substrate-binding protein